MTTYLRFCLFNHQRHHLPTRSLFSLSLSCALCYTRRTKPINVIKGFSTSICACVWSEKQVNHHHHHQQRVFLSVDNLFIFSDGILWWMILISHDLPTKMFHTHLLKTKTTTTTTTIKKVPKHSRMWKEFKRYGSARARSRKGFQFMTRFFFVWVCRWRKGTPARD